MAKHISTYFHIPLTFSYLRSFLLILRKTSLNQYRNIHQGLSSNGLLSNVSIRKSVTFLACVILEVRYNPEYSTFYLFSYPPHICSRIHVNIEANRPQNRSSHVDKRTTLVYYTWGKKGLYFSWLKVTGQQPVSEYSTTCFIN